MSVHFSSKSDNWSTPDYLFKKYNDLYDFNLDVCASSENAKCSIYFTYIHIKLAKNKYVS